MPRTTGFPAADAARDFDRRFRPTSARSRERWERIAAAERRGEPMPPISVYRLGDLHFGRDSHHRVSVARARGERVIEADVTEVQTRLPATGIRSHDDLVCKDYERLFRERVPLPPERKRHCRWMTPGTDASSRRPSRHGAFA